MKPIRSATLRALTARGVELDCDGGLVCRVSILGADLGRVLYTRPEGFRARRSWSVLRPGQSDTPWDGLDRDDETGWPEHVARVEQAEGEIRLVTEAMTATIRLAPFGITWALPDGRVFARERKTHPTMFGRSRIIHAFERTRADRYFGLGDKTGPLDLNGRRLRIAMRDSLGYDPERGDPLYKHWPFLITVDGHSGVASGVFYDNLAEAVFDLGCEHDNYYDLFRSYEATDGDLDYYVFPGPGLVDVTRKFLTLTGRPPMPPRWTLGFSQTAMALADSPNGQERVGQFIDRCISDDIPISAFHFGSGYTMIGPKRYVFTWNTSKYPEPPALMARFHEAGMRIVANIKPCLLDDHPRYAEPYAGFVKDSDGQPVIRQFWDGEGAHLDFTHPVAVQWWQGGVTNDVLATGINAAWNDNNEYGFDDETALCNGFGTPVAFNLARPVQSHLMTRASLEATQAKAPGERAFTVTRAGMPGVQRYAQSWSGDNETSWRGLAWGLRTGLTMSLSGIGNTGHDVGGFSGPIPSAELLVRWTQSGVLHPRFIMNSWKPDGVYTAPWLHEEVLPLVREAIRLRYRLMPYFYSLMVRHSEDGTPPLLPTFAQFPADPKAWQDCPDLMLGPWLLGAPVVEEGARTRAVYLPAGPDLWFDFWTGAPLRAGEITNRAAPLSLLPLFVPAGGILPLTRDVSRETLHDEPSRHLRVFPGSDSGESRFELIEDDGITLGGPRTRVDITLRWTREKVIVAAHARGDYKLPWSRMRVTLPLGESRGLDLQGDLLERG